MEENKAGLRRIYRKSWPFDNLFGTSRFDFTAAQRGVWNDLLDMAKLSRVYPGVIAAGPGAPYTHEWMAAFLNIPLETLNETIEICKAKNRITENGDGIKIENWLRYQSEYERQKPYRKAAKAGKVIEKKCPACDWKGKTDSETCPECEAHLVKDYKGQKYGHLIVSSKEDIERIKQEKKRREAWDSYRPDAPRG